MTKMNIYNSLSRLLASDEVIAVLFSQVAFSRLSFREEEAPRMMLKAHLQVLKIFRFVKTTGAICPNGLREDAFSGKPRFSLRQTRPYGGFASKH